MNTIIQGYIDEREYLIQTLLTSNNQTSQRSHPNEEWIKERIKEIDSILLKLGEKEKIVLDKWDKGTLQDPYNPDNYLRVTCNTNK